MNSTYNFYYKAPSETLAESIALFARMTVQPTQKQKTVINDTIKSLKNEGIWEKLDVFVMLHSHDLQAAYLNWKKAEYNGTPANAPIYTNYSGVLSASTKYIDSNYIPLNAFNYSLNSVTLGVATNTNSQTAAVDIGRNVGNSLSSILQTRNLSNLIQVIINKTVVVANAAKITINDSLGITSTSLYNNVLNLYKNGNNILSTPYTPSALQSTSILVGQNVARNYQAYFLGGALSDQQHANLTLIINNYLNNYINE